MTLTSEFIEASDDKTAREIRDELVADIFPKLTDDEKEKFSDHTELDDMLRVMEANFGHIIHTDEELMRAAKEAIAHLRHSEAVQKHEENRGSEQGQGKFAAGLNSIEKMVLLLKGDILGSAEYNVAHERRLSLIFEVFGGLEDDMIEYMYDVTEMNDAMREFRDVPMEGDHHYRSMAVALYIENLKEQCYARNQSNSSSAGGYDDNNWEPF